ncbi:hypothetical protein H5410_005607 [Solanum commersonii]|uniref:Uncharacterized protein n=1 Tax=Solanum commersonii TaxID=4109 RepID=A0A9J6A726_SOLCO|nr:hypothetical protein H5410_005607 [Solanum commersonii]
MASSTQATSRLVKALTARGNGCGLVFKFGDLWGKAWTLLSKKEQRQPKERRNEDLRIAELVRRVTKRSYPRLLFQCAEP